ncbi:Endonuclease/exonuclease/phosphatase [Lipomyces oligophaga]|uniref:Endonuclease/exonuclease/phosphatase n=1 Tax=Lipomyces oligophaga TaxID=45792 RepID=UPI0034CF5BCD
MSATALVFTYNCNRRVHSYGSIRSALLEAVDTISDSTPPLFIFLSLQELTPVHDAFYFDNSEQYLAPFVQAVISLTDGGYKQVVVSSVGPTFGALFVAADRDDEFKISDIRTSAVSFGAMSTALKGVCAIRLTFEGVELTFVAAHFAAHSGKRHVRDSNFVNAARKLAFFGELSPGDEYTSFAQNDEQRDRDFFYKDNCHLIFAGDLNYRVDVQESTTTVASKGWTWPFPESSFLEWLPDDELSTVISADKPEEATAFWGFKEADITFDPTFKIKRPLKNGAVESDFQAYSSSRVPSWCDRVLYFDGFEDDSSSASSISVLKYSSIPSVAGSDHFPVYAILEIPLATTPGPISSVIGDLLATKGIATTTEDEITNSMHDEQQKEREAETETDADANAPSLSSEQLEQAEQKKRQLRALYKITTDQMSAQTSHRYARMGKLRKLESLIGFFNYYFATVPGFLWLITYLVISLALYLQIKDPIAEFLHVNKGTSILALIFGVDRIAPRYRRHYSIAQPEPTTLPV